MITSQEAIAALMENAPFSAGLSGSTSLVTPQAITIQSTPTSSGHNQDVYDQQNGPEFSQEQLAAAAEFLQLVGDIDTAKQLLDRCDECGDCLGLDDENNDDFDTRTIESIALEAPEYE